MDQSPQALRAIFMGSPDFAVPSLQATAKHCDVSLVVSQPDRPAGRGRKLKAPEVKVQAQALGLPVIQPLKMRDPELHQQLRELNPDLIVVVAYGRILPKAILDIPKYGCINVHASILPRWRGAAPIQRAVLAGDQESGVSIMRLDEGCDTGPVFRIERTPIGENETSGELFDRLAKLGGSCLQDFLKDFSPEQQAQEQDHDQAVHAAKLEKSEGQIDWSRPSHEVHNHIRGMDPWPGAFTELPDGSTMKVFSARRMDADAAGNNDNSTAGRVKQADPSGIVVACGQGCVRIEELQVAGKKRMSAESFLQGGRIKVGDVLGVSADQ